MKLVWLSLVLSTAGEGVSNSSKSETYAQRNGLGTFLKQNTDHVIALVPRMFEL